MLRNLAPFLAIAALLASCGGAPVAKPGTWRSAADVLAQSQPSDWRPLDPAATLYLELAAGRVVIELAPAFAPAHIARIAALTRAQAPLKGSVVRVQDNYVVQWAAEAVDPTPTSPALPLPAEYTRTADGLPFAVLADGDVYAPQVGWSLGFPAAREPADGTTWLAHCYGMVGVGRDMPPDTGDGTELYVVTGHAPRHLDRNLAVVGRVLRGMELLTSLPRGTEAMGFYAKPDQRAPIAAIRLASDVPPAVRTELEVMRTDTPTWSAWVESRRNRREAFFVNPAGRVELCNVAIPVRMATPAKP